MAVRQHNSISSLLIAPSSSQTKVVVAKIIVFSRSVCAGLLFSLIAALPPVGWHPSS